MFTNYINRNNKLKYTFRLLLIVISLGFIEPHTALAQFPVQVTTSIRQPVSPYLPEIMADIRGERYNKLGRDITNQVSVILRNTQNSPVQIKLMGKIERLSPGPMSISVSPGFQPSTPIVLRANQTQGLNHRFLEDAFGGFVEEDVIFNNINLADLKDNGVNYKLPEGIYQFCVTAYDYNTPGFSKPLSPLGTGCATFRICYSASAPQIIMPISTITRTHSSFEPYTPITPQIQFTWTPPSSTCGLPLGPISYDLVINRAFPGQTVNDALNNPPVFVRSNIHTNTFLLDTLRFPNVFMDGERYVVRVKANIMSTMNDSPLEITNQGYSELGAFTYKSPKATKMIAQAPEKKVKISNIIAIESPQFATKSISGQLKWAFKESEVTFAINGSPDINSTISNMLKNRNSATTIQLDNTPISTYLGENNILSTSATALGQVDPTLSLNNMLNVSQSASSQINTFTESTPRVRPVATEAPVDPASIISSNGAKSISYRYTNTPKDTGDVHYPLAGTTIYLKAKIASKSSKQNHTTNTTNVSSVVATSSNFNATVENAILRNKNSWKAGDISSQSSASTHASHPEVKKQAKNSMSGNRIIVLATAVTDANGHFTFNYIPSVFSQHGEIEELFITANSPGFYDFKYDISLNPKDTAAKYDVGEIVLLANTYRLITHIHNPSINNSSIDLGNTIVSVYRETNEIDHYPFMQNEGVLSQDLRSNKFINGKKYTLVANDSIGQRTHAGQTFEFGNLFYQGNLHIVVSSPKKNIQDLHTDLRITPQPSSPSRTMIAKVDYDITLTQPAIEGNVMLIAGKNSSPIHRAVIKVSFDEDDLLHTETGSIEHKTPDLTYDLNSIREHNIPNPLEYSANFSHIGLSTPMSIMSHNVSSSNHPSTIDGLSISTDELIVTPAISQELNQEIVNQIVSNPSSHGKYSAISDQDGYFYIGNLPILKEGAQYTIEVVSLPIQHRGLPIQPEVRQLNIFQGEIAFAEFIVSGEAIPISGRVVDANGEPLADARLNFKGSNHFFESNGDGYFSTSNSEGTHTLIIEKPGYIKNEGKVHIKKDKKAKVDPPLSKTQNTSQTSTSSYRVSTPYVLPYVPSGGVLGAGGFGSPQSSSAQSLLNTELWGHSSNLSSNMKNLTTKTSQMSVRQPTLVAKANKPNDAINQTLLESHVGDIGFLAKKMAKVKFIVKNKDDKSEKIEHAIISLFDTTHTTNANGEWIYHGYGGNVDVTVFPPQGSTYVPLVTSVDLGEDNKLVEITLLMEKGVRLFGKVNSNENPLDSVSITIEGNNLLYTLSMEGGYELYVPHGEQEIRAAKKGYMVQKEWATFNKGSEVELNFDLQDGGGKNISQLLGFDIELEKSEPIANSTEEYWTGRFVNLQPYFAPALISDRGNYLPFAKIKVAFDEDGNALPEGNEVQTDRKTLPLLLFDYLPIAFKNEGEQIIVKRNNKGWGSISGQLSLDVDRLLGKYDISFIKSYLPRVVLKNHQTPGSIEVFLGEGASGLPGIGDENRENLEGMIEDAVGDAMGNIPGASDAIDQANDAINQANQAIDEANQYIVDAENLEFRFAAPGTDPLKIELYGFSVTLDLANSTINRSGIKLAGEINTPQQAIIKSLKIPFNELSLNQSLDIKGIEIDTEMLPKLEVGPWYGALNSLSINESGVKLGGELAFKIPQSDTARLQFSDLRVSTDGIYGGRFKISDEIDIFGAAKLKNKAQEFVFGQIGNSGIYSLAGEVDMIFQKLLEKKIEVERFQIQTDGRFSVQVPTNYSYDFGFASYSMNNIELTNPPAGMPYIKLFGTFKSDISFLKFEASDFTFRASRSGTPELIIDSIGASIENPLVNCGLGLTISNDRNRKGFGGSGRLNIPNTPVGADVSFRYYKLTNGIEIGASFLIGVPLVIGTVQIDKLGGGFDYESDKKKFKVNIQGRLSLPGAETVVALDPLKLEVESGPVIRGSTDVVVGSTFELAQANVVMDFPGKYFAVTANASTSPMEGVSVTMNGLFRVSWSQNPYAFLGVSPSVKIANLLEADGKFVLAINAEINKNGSDDMSSYFNKLDWDLVTKSNSYKLSGMYANASMEKGFNIGPYNYKIVKFDAEFNAKANVDVLLNFQKGVSKGDYLLGLGGSFRGHVEGSVLGLSAGVHVSSCFAFKGGRTSQSGGWFLNGKAALDAVIKLNPGNVGCNSIHYTGGTVVKVFTFGLADNDIIPVGFKSCIPVHLTINYKESDRLKLGGGLYHKGGAECNL